MVWLTNIEDLQYYKSVKDLPCYCEEMIYPNDMLLQAILAKGGSASLGISLDGLTPVFYVYSADGLTQYEDATAYFDYYFAIAKGGGDTYMNARLKAFSPQMCAHKCFIIRLVITNTAGRTVFDSYTERYCVSECCAVAMGITYEQGNITEEPATPAVIETVPAAPEKPTSACGLPLIRLISKYSCGSVFDGNYYNDPDTVISGTASFNYVKVSSFQGRIVQRPREIKREISYNCVLQKSESTKPYLLEGFEYFPTWKMNEIENQLHANEIWVDDFTNYKEYQFAGGTAFNQVNKCFELFKLSTFLQDCTQRQIFGCDDCITTTTYFVIPTDYAGGAFFSDNKLKIAAAYDGEEISPPVPGLLQWLRSQDGVTSVEDVDISELECEMYAVVAVKGFGAIPSSIYYDSAIAGNRLFAVNQETIEGICGVVGDKPCSTPVNDEVVIITFACATPANDTVIILPIIPDTVTVTDYPSWTIDTGETSASILKGQVTLSIKSDNSSIVAAADTEYTFINETIGVIDAESRPAKTVVLDHSTVGSIPEGASLTIEPSGRIIFSGTITVTVENEATIDIDNIFYNVN